MHITIWMKKYESQIADFAKLHQLPTVRIGGLLRPVLGSGLWWAIHYLVNEKHGRFGSEEEDRDSTDTTRYMGQGHIVPPLPRCIELAKSQLLQLDFSSKRTRWVYGAFLARYMNGRMENERLGAIIVAADNLGIEMRQYDYFGVDVEFKLPYSIQQLVAYWPSLNGKPNILHPTTTTS